MNKEQKIVSCGCISILGVIVLLLMAVLVFTLLISPYTVSYVFEGPGRVERSWGTTIVHFGNSTHTVGFNRNVSGAPYEILVFSNPVCNGAAAPIRLISARIIDLHDESTLWSDNTIKKKEPFLDGHVNHMSMRYSNVSIPHRDIILELSVSVLCGEGWVDELLKFPMRGVVKKGRVMVAV